MDHPVNVHRLIGIQNQTLRFARDVCELLEEERQTTEDVIMENAVLTEDNQDLRRKIAQLEAIPGQIMEELKNEIEWIKSYDFTKDVLQYFEKKVFESYCPRRDEQEIEINQLKMELEKKNRTIQKLFKSNMRIKKCSNCKKKCGSKTKCHDQERPVKNQKRLSKKSKKIERGEPGVITAEYNENGAKEI